MDKPMMHPMHPNMVVVGQRVKVVVAPHMKGHDVGTVRQVVDGALGIEFDGMPGEVHHWYVPSEVMVIGAPSEETEAEGDQGKAQRAAAPIVRSSSVRGGRAFHALTSTPWAIVPAELHTIAAIAQRQPLVLDAKGGEPEYAKRDYALMAGPSAQKIPGAYRAYVIDGVAILPIAGPIFPRANVMTEYSGATSIAMLHNDHRLVMENKDIGALMLLMDTPGGAVAGVNSFADAVYEGAKKKMTVAHVTGSAASAGYWIASQASRITLERTGVLGSIGVIAAVPKQVAPDAEGYLDIEIVSSNAPNKRPDPQTEEGQAQIRALLDTIEDEFIADVARGRKIAAAKVRSDFLRGGVDAGAKVVALGMADKVQSQDATFRELRAHAMNQRRLAALKQN